MHRPCKFVSCVSNVYPSSASFSLVRESLEYVPTMISDSQDFISLILITSLLSTLDYSSNLILLTVLAILSRK